jgi:hypothetical protein
MKAVGPAGKHLKGHKYEQKVRTTLIGVKEMNFIVNRRKKTTDSSFRTS